MRRRWWVVGLAVVIVTVVAVGLLVWSADPHDLGEPSPDDSRNQAAAECQRVRSEEAAERAFDASRPGPAVAFLGDSYTVGRGATSMSTGYAVRAADLLHLQPFLAGSSGSGFVGAGMCHDAAYSSRVAEVVARGPRLVVVQGGLNDVHVAPAEITAAATGVLGRLRTALPGADVVLLGPIDPVGGNPDLPGVAAALRGAADGTGVRFVDPMAEGWVTPENRPAVMTGDGLHPNQVGHDLIAERLVADLGSPADADPTR